MQRVTQWDGIETTRGRETTQQPTNQPNERTKEQTKRAEREATLWQEVKMWCKGMEASATPFLSLETLSLWLFVV